MTKYKISVKTNTQNLLYICQRVYYPYRALNYVIYSIKCIVFKKESEWMF